MKRVGILTGGGDCPGLNPAIRGAVIRGLEFGCEMLGLQEGWRGLLDKLVVPLTRREVDGIVGRGGTILGSSRTNPFKGGDNDSNALLATRNFRELGLDALIAIGGDDTLGVANKLYHRGFNTVGVPKTMDNDLSETDYTFGFDSAVGVAVEAIDRLRDTADSHRRIMVCEVMGRNAGWVALFAGIASGADWALIPEQSGDYTDPRLKLDLVAMCRHLACLPQQGKQFALVVVSEGVNLLKVPQEQRAQLSQESQAQLEELAQAARVSGQVDAFGHPILGEQIVGQRIADIIYAETQRETRHVVLGHVVRGGPPTVFDRILGTRVGVKAAEMVRDGQFGMMAALRGTEMVAVRLDDAVGMSKTVPAHLYELALKLF